MIDNFTCEDGINLVDRFTELKEQEQKIKQGLEDVRVKLINFAQHKSINRIEGTNQIVNVKDFYNVVYDKGRLIGLLKEKGLYGSVSVFNHSKFNSLVMKGNLDPEVRDLVKTEKSYRISLLSK